MYSSVFKWVLLLYLWTNKIIIYYTILESLYKCSHVHVCVYDLVQYMLRDSTKLW